MILANPSIFGAVVALDCLADRPVQPIVLLYNYLSHFRSPEVTGAAFTAVSRSLFISSVETFLM